MLLFVLFIITRATVIIMRQREGKPGGVKDQC